MPQAGPLPAIEEVYWCRRALVRPPNCCIPPGGFHPGEGSSVIVRDAQAGGREGLGVPSAAAWARSLPPPVTLGGSAKFGSMGGGSWRG